MREYVYKKADAFTSGASLGNPAASLYLNEGQTLTPEEMLRIAKAHQGFVSEMVYCRPSEKGGYHLTYYSSQCEVDFCGHGTIACMYELIKANPSLLLQKEIPLHTNSKGDLMLYNEIQAEDAVYVAAPVPREYRVTLSRADIAKALAAGEDDLQSPLPLDLIDAGLKTLIVPVANLSGEISLWPNEQELKAFCRMHGLDIILIFSMERADTQNIAHTRVFAPKFGYLEDPATGSGNSAFGYYLLKNGLWNGEPVSIEQGGEDRVYNRVCLSAPGGRVRFGGRAALRISGTYYL